MIYVYQDKRPFIIDKKSKKGLAYEFVELLNKYSRYQYDLRITPRPRLDKISDKIILFVNEQWFKTKDANEYLYSSPIFQDESIYISLSNSPIEPSKHQFKGLKIAVLNASAYPTLNEEAFNRIDVFKEEQSIELLLKKRVSLAIVSRSSFKYYLKSKNIDKKAFYTSNEKDLVFDRKIMFTKKYKKNLEEYEAIIKNELFKKELTLLIQKYIL